MNSLIGLLCILTFAAANDQELETIFEWNLLRYNTPDGYPRNGTFRAGSTEMTSIEVGSERVFFAVPKINTDNPATLVYVPKNTEERNPAFEAYPSWDWHAGSVAGELITKYTCHGFINVFRIKADRCGRLWALDSGLPPRYGDGPVRSICPPKLVAFDLSTDKEVKRIVFKKNVLRRSSQLMEFVIDDTDESGAQPQGNCDVGHIYVVDLSAPGIVVYNMQTKETWRHSDPSLYPDPQHGKITVAGESVIFMAGIIGIALSAPGPGNNRDVFYSPLASKSIYSVNTVALKKKPNENYLLELPVRKFLEKTSQSAPLCFDQVENSILFSPMNETALVAYHLEEREFRVISYDPIALQWVSDIKSAILDDNNIWVTSTRWQKVLTGTATPREINRRVLRLRRSLSPAKSSSSLSYLPPEYFTYPYKK